MNRPVVLLRISQARVSQTRSHKFSPWPSCSATPSRKKKLQRLSKLLAKRSSLRATALAISTRKAAPRSARPAWVMPLLRLSLNRSAVRDIKQQICHWFIASGFLYTKRLPEGSLFFMNEVPSINLERHYHQERRHLAINGPCKPSIRYRRAFAYQTSC